ncbi:hypothetical protein D3C75_1333450 [compost metagenome]
MPVASSIFSAAMAIVSNEDAGIFPEAASCAKTRAAAPTVPTDWLTLCACEASASAFVPAALPFRISALVNAVVSSLPCL